MAERLKVIWGHRDMDMVETTIFRETSRAFIESRLRVDLDCQKRSEEKNNYNPLLPLRNDSDWTGWCLKRSAMVAWAPAAI